MTKKIYLGAGCFWGVEHLLKKMPGVLSTAVGYMGGHTKNPSYRDVCNGDTGHAEVVKVEYDAEKISLEELLNIFWRLHDPTQLNRQGVDVGTQYRSAIFCESEDQAEVAKRSMQKFNEKKIFSRPAVTEIRVDAGPFYPAEDYHQDYFGKSGGPVCHALRRE